MQQERQPTRAEQRMAAVAKLKRAASLPRMKDGRRPPMHTDAVSEGEKPPMDEDTKGDSTPPQDPQEHLDDTTEPEAEREVLAEAQLGADTEPAAVPEPEVEEAERAISPEPASRSKRRSRSRTRSRGSKDLRGKARATQSPTPTPPAAGDSSQDEAPMPMPPPLNLATLAPLMSPIPSHILELQRSRLLRSPTPTSSESPIPHGGGALPQNPVLLPTLEAWQRGLLRSNSAGGSNTAGRMMAMHKLTGGTESYEPLGSLSPSPSPLGKLNRSNTVTGGERTAARQLMLSRLGGRIGKEIDGEQASGGEGPAPASTTKKRRRRSRRGSQSANAGVSDSEFLSTSPNTPSIPPTPLPTAFDALSELLLRSRSATPYQLANPPTYAYDVEEYPQPLQPEPVHEPERHEPMRRRSVVVEEDEDEQYIPQRAYPAAPLPQHIAAFRTPYVADPRSNDPLSSPSPPAISLSAYPNQRTPPVNDVFPRSPYAMPLKEVSSQDDDEEQVLYQPDTLRPRTPYEDNSEREISWIATPVPEIDTRMPIHDEEDDEMDEPEEEYQDADEPPSSPRSSNDYSAQDTYDDTSPRVSSSSKSLFVESETSPAASPVASPSHVSLTPSGATPSHTASITRASDDGSSPQYPMRLSVASRSPMYGEFPDWDDRTNTDSPSKRPGDSPSTWEKVKSTFSRAGSTSGRRSRTNSIAARERRDRADSINRESGASLGSARTDKVDASAQQQSQPLMLSSSASASISSLAPPTAARGGSSPIPLLTSVNKSKYQHAKLFPFGMATTPEARMASASASSPDIVMQSSSNEEDVPSTPHTPERTGEYRLSHKTSDTHLASRLNLSSLSTSQLENLPRSPSQTGGSYKLPMTLPGVKQWLSKNKKIFSSSSPAPASPVRELRPLTPSHKPSAPDGTSRKESEQLGADWEEVGTTPTSPLGESVFRLGPNGNGSTSIPRSEHTDTEKTPKARKIMPPLDHGDNGISFFEETPLSTPSHPDPLSTTPDPYSSLSDYPAHSTSESSSTTSSQYSLAPQGPLFLERVDEELSRGSRSRIWATSLDDPPRKLLLSTPVFQVVNHNTLKDRFLFLFSDILVVAKPVFMDQEAYVDKNPVGRKFIVKNVVQLSKLRFTEGRAEMDDKETNGTKSRDRLVGLFVANFAKDPENAVNSLCIRSGHGDDPVAVGQLLFKTLDLDRARLGDYLARKTAKSVLKVYLDSFGFLGLRVDKALRVFLLSIHIPSSSQHHNALEYLLEAFASRWYEANARLMDYKKDQAHRFVRAIVQLNDLLHGAIAQEPGPTETPRRDVTSDDFVDAFRRYDQKSSVSDGLLRDVYESILHERLSHSPNAGSPTESIAIKRGIPLCLTWKIESEPIVFRIPHADADLSIELYGQDLVFDPPVINFGKSPEVSFRIKALSLGSKSIIMRRAGPNALKYTGLPLSSPILVERAFMRHTLQVAFENQHGLKRRYMFSIDDSLIRHQWAVHMRRQMEKAVEGSKLGTKFRRAAEALAFTVLQETLIGSQAALANAVQKVSQRNNVYPPNLNGASRFMHDRNGSGSNGFQLQPIHNRSKSRSKVYHLHGAGKIELDLSQPLSHRGAHSDDDDKADITQERNDGPLWSTEDLKMVCEQNGTIASLLSYLQTLSSEPAELSSS
ncbi:hypothetical protein H0H81_002947 [Sphagnurus paluster]|uniref:SEC7 domain-containing protein n=1 Tax=Sphagnurus paluster TaxID=117069 RepID=A0A9P7G213_9AGAR|nr:hypothetical protein H0H81_002947 [Sphagnurus paluster]